MDDLDRKLDNRFMWLLAAFAAGFLALGGLILNRTDATSSKIDTVSERLEAKIDAVDERLGAKIDVVSQRVSALSERTARLEARISPRP